VAKPQGNPKPFDNSHVPPAVRRAAEEAERLQKELTSQGKPEEGGEPQEPQEPPAPTNPEPEQPPQEPRPTNPEPEPPKQDDQSWEARYKAEHGRLEAARRQIDEMSQRMDNMARVMSTLQATAPAPAPTPVADENQFRFVTDEMKQEWGDDFMAAVEAKAKELIAPLERKLENQLQQVGSRVDNVVQKTHEDARVEMMTHLDKTVPGWIDQNENQDFVAWLKMPDTYSRRIRKDLLLEAWNSNDASTVAAFFEGYRREAGLTAPQSPAPAPAPAPKPPLEKFAAPGVPRSAAPANGPAEVEPVSRADIARFYADVAAGRFRGREADQQAYEKTIFEAQKAGRIT
jgi:hypothetical protein